MRNTMLPPRHSILLSRSSATHLQCEIELHIRADYFLELIVVQLGITPSV